MPEEDLSLPVKIISLESLTNNVELIATIYRIVNVLDFKRMNDTLKGPCVKGLVVWKLGKEAVYDKARNGHKFQWKDIGKVDRGSLTNSEEDEDVQQSMLTMPRNWHIWLYQVCLSETGVTPVLEKRMPRELNKDERESLILRLCKYVYLQYPHLTPEESVKKAWKLCRAKVMAQLTRDPTDLDLSQTGTS